MHEASQSSFEEQTEGVQPGPGPRDVLGSQRVGPKCAAYIKASACNRRRCEPRTSRGPAVGSGCQWLLLFGSHPFFDPSFQRIYGQSAIAEHLVVELPDIESIPHLFGGISAKFF